jgi:hypothetical protein
MGITNSSIIRTISFREESALSPLFRRNARHCVCLFGRSKKSGRYASHRQRSTPRIECCPDRRSKRCTLEFEPLRQYPEIVKVFHAAVRHAQFDHGFKLFSNYAFLRMGLQFRSRKFQERRIFQFLWPRNNCVSETDINLQRNTHIAQSYLQQHSNSPLYFIVSDSVRTNSVRKKHEAIVFDLL